MPKILRKYIHAILNDEVKIQGMDNPNARVKDLTLIIDGESIPLYDFMTQNDWDNTVVGDETISFKEQEAVLDYVEDSGPFRALSGLFNPEYNLIPPDNNLQNRKSTPVEIVNFLKTIINMQSAFNKARILSPQSSVEVYHNMDQLDASKDFYQISGIASTTRDEKVFSKRPVKLTIKEKSDAIPLEKIITHPKLKSAISWSEKENFLGVRPLFKLHKKSSDHVKTSQTVYEATHINRKAMRAISRAQRFFKEKQAVKKAEHQIKTHANHSNKKVK